MLSLTLKRSAAAERLATKRAVTRPIRDTLRVKDSAEGEASAMTSLFQLL
jgi:hypothetical protein